MNFTVTPVYKIREITDKEEVIVDILASVCDENVNINVFDVGYAILCLQSGERVFNTGIPFDENSSKKFIETVNNCLGDLLVFMRKQRGYVNN